MNWRNRRRVIAQKALALLILVLVGIGWSGQVTGIVDNKTEVANDE